MGIYLNPGNAAFQEMRNSDIYVDKSEMISILNRKIKTKDKYVCVSRPRRFGKSVDAEMLVAYYGKNCDSYELFDDLKISKHESYETHLNKHHVIHIDVQEFLSKCNNVSEIK